MSFSLLGPASDMPQPVPEDPPVEDVVDQTVVEVADVNWSEITVTPPATATLKSQLQTQAKSEAPGLNQTWQVRYNTLLMEQGLAPDNSVWS